MLCLLLTLAACGHKPLPHILLTVDSLASAAPDSAVALLKQPEVKSALTSTYVKVVAVLTVLFFTGYGLLFWYVNKKEAERRARRRDQRGPRKP